MITIKTIGYFFYHQSPGGARISRDRMGVFKLVAGDHQEERERNSRSTESGFIRRKYIKRFFFF